MIIVAERSLQIYVALRAQLNSFCNCSLEILHRINWFYFAFTVIRYLILYICKTREKTYKIDGIYYVHKYLVCVLSLFILTILIQISPYQQN